MAEPGTAVVEGRDLSKHYGALTALRDVDITLHAGEVLGLVGDNGAGKSTLTGLLSGALTPSEGEIRIGGKLAHLRSPADARAQGIETVFQDLALSPDLSVADHLFLGREQLSGRAGRLGWLDRRAMRKRCEEELQRLSVRVNSVSAPCRALSGGQRQAIAIARAIVWSRTVLLLDEPTAALGVEQQEQVGRLIRRAAGDGLAVLLISHNMQQVIDLCDRVVVLFQGSLIADLRHGQFEVEDLVSWITGAKLRERERQA
jgi:ABC-type sugar transport system ATPase subunit